LTITALGATSNGGTVTTNGLTVTYTPAAGFTGTETFTYTISDGRGGSDTATVTIFVNAPPQAVNDSYTVQQNSSNNILPVRANDSDPNGDPLTITALGAT